jgi:aminoglycoside phosphotransferase
VLGVGFRIQFLGLGYRGLRFRIKGARHRDRFFSVKGIGYVEKGLGLRV